MSHFYVIANQLYNKYYTIHIKGWYRLLNVFYGTATRAATNMMFESLRKNVCGTNCRCGWAESAFCGKECLYVHPENRQFLVRSTAIQLRLGTYS